MSNKSAVRSPPDGVQASEQAQELHAFEHWILGLESAYSSNASTLGLSRWYRSESFNAYVRRLPAKPLATGHLGKEVLVLASVEVRPEWQGQGFFSRLIERLVKGAGTKTAQVLQIENVINERLEHRLLRLGFKSNNQPLAPSVYRPIQRG